MSYIWPIALIVFSNAVYQICAKSVPGDIDPLASLTVTYAVGAVVSGILYTLIGKGSGLLGEYSHLNWAPFVLGFAIVGLEFGSIKAYQAGWPISLSAIVQSVFLGIILIAVGYLLYHEAITLTKVAGIAVCMVGLFLINR